MKKMSKWLVPLSMSAALLAACGGNESGGESLDENNANNAGNNQSNNGESNGEQSDVVETGEADQGVEATGDESVQLDMWIHQTGEEETDFYIKRIDEFNEAHEDIFVNVEIIIDDGGSSYSDSINAALVAGNLPDILALDGPYVASFAESDIIRSIDEYISVEDLEDFVDSIIQQGSYDGELYSLGAMEASIPLYYNKDIFEEEGIEAPTTIEDAWTWDEFLTVAQDLTTEDRYGLNLFMNYGVGEWLTFMGGPFVWSNNGELISEDGSTSDGYLNSPETVESLEFIKTLFEEGVVSLTPGEMQFEEGNAAMALGGPWIAVSAENADMNWGMMPYPYKEVPKSPSGSMAYGITTLSEHPEEAFQMMHWMTNEESTIGLSEVTGMPPVRESAFNAMDKYDELPWSVMRDQVLETAHARPQTPAYPVLTDAFAQAFHAAALGEDVEETLNQQVERVERELRRFQD
ncbi:ABC transporter substrate-binding protein [Salipaludibacillus keqinensis]|uniref:ABC transporter substrate-binding protein n=1 Tax=Salipaludibacillus keqinensis TaxID=2045207 RepID=A0A323TEH7_9BACI|nr:sugar ABC transporter substrate-binding protein [Salipaludibacillus keqinensis]PYZ93461.1 ABC transporter substrate-binding protein [Salipaludibacillus keqinensis]